MITFEGDTTKLVVSEDLNLFPIEKRIIESLHAALIPGYLKNADAVWKSDAHWTFSLKKALSDLGTRAGYLVLPELKEGLFTGQWLFDLTWVDAKSELQNGEMRHDWRHMRGLRLACESEWNAYEESILEDFLKLTVVNAEIRLFIYTNPTSGHTTGGTLHPVEICKQSCPLSRGYRYLLIGFPKKREGKIRVDAWTA